MTTKPVLSAFVRPLRHPWDNLSRLLSNPRHNPSSCPRPKPSAYPNPYPERSRSPYRRLNPSLKTLSPSSQLQHILHPKILHPPPWSTHCRPMTQGIVSYAFVGSSPRHPHHLRLLSFKPLKWPTLLKHAKGGSFVLKYHHGGRGKGGAYVHVRTTGAAASLGLSKRPVSHGSTLGGRMASLPFVPLTAMSEKL